jgi:hypothetical protein
MKKLLTVFALLFVAPVFADDVTLDQFVKLLKTDLRAQAKEEIRLGMVTFTAEEAKLFWPIYDAYMAELGKFLDARVALVAAYAEDYDNMTDAKAKELLDRRFDQLKQRDKLEVKYRPQFAKALSPRRLVRFYQIQHELEVLIAMHHPPARNAAALHDAEIAVLFAVLLATMNFQVHVCWPECQNLGRLKRG